MFLFLPHSLLKATYLSLQDEDLTHQWPTRIFPQFREDIILIFGIGAAIPRFHRVSRTQLRRSPVVPHEKYA